MRPSPARGRCMARLALSAAAALAGGTVAASPRAPLPAPAPAARLDTVGARPPRGRVSRDPLPLVSQDRLLATLAELTAIGADSFFRTSASRGEAAAFDLVAQRLGELPFLAAAGLELERQSFRTFLGHEAWEVRLFLQRPGGGEIEVPAHALQPHRDDLVRALRLDSDGVLNDTERNPVEVDGPALPVRTLAQLNALTPASIQGRIVLLDYALVDRSIMTSTEAITRAVQLLAKGPAGIVLVTERAHVPGASHGSFAGDLGAFTLATSGTPRPTLYVRLEDLGAAGVTSWGDLAIVSAVRLRWDADVVSPGRSQNLIARIPGPDASRAVILGAHLDSANSPGALDDGSGVVSLLEVARTLDAARVRPPVDLYLCFFGSHERGLFGSSVFLQSHSDLLDRALAMLEVDCLRRPLDGLPSWLTLEARSLSMLGNATLPWPEFLRQAASTRGLWPSPLDNQGIVSDNSCFAAFDVPNADLIYLDSNDPWEAHYSGHLHDPFDDVVTAAEVAPVLADMARVALTAALVTGAEAPVLRVTPPPDRRAVLLASHTESPHFSASLIDFGMALAWEGFDLDVVPYGTPVTSAHLDGAGLVVALPVHDWPSPEGDASSYEETWSGTEIDALQQYAEAGGLLVLTNSRYRMKYANSLYETNEDWAAGNPLAQPFGVAWIGGQLGGSVALPRGTSPLVSGVAQLVLAGDNGVPFTFTGGSEVARVGLQPAAALLRPGGGAGEVLVLADLGILGAGASGPVNLRFWQNLARYARSR